MWIGVPAARRGAAAETHDTYSAEQCGPYANDGVDMHAQGQHRLFVVNTHL